MIWRRIRSVWSILDPLTVNVQVPPRVCLNMLQAAARPSTERLYLRETFADSRRYFVEATADGFRMATTAKTPFNPRRTSASCFVRGQVTVVNGGASISLRAVFRPIAFVYTFWVPLAMVWLMWPVPWPRLLIVGLLAVLFGVAWASLRYAAALEATEMVFFVTKAFENVPKFSLAALTTKSDISVQGSEFDLMWEQFVQSHTSDG